MSSHRQDDTAVLRRLRRLLGVFFVGGLLGIGTELLLLGHTEGGWQKLPLGLIGLGLIVAFWHARAPGRQSLRAYRGLCLLLVAVGLAGLVQHCRGNLEFARELYPSAGGWELFRQVMTGATPALAPMALAGLGLLGFIAVLATTQEPRGSL